MRSSRVPTFACTPRNRLPQNIPSVARAIASLPVENLILDGEITWDRVRRVSRLRRRLARRSRRHDRCRSSSVARCWPGCRCRRRSQRVAALDDPNPWERAEREGWEGVIAKRRGSRYESPPIAALAQDEVRSLAGTRRRRLHRSARRARRSWCAAGRILRRGQTSCSPARSAPASTRSCCSTCAADSTPSKWPRRHSRKRKACRVFARTGCVPRSSSRWRFIEWTVHGKLRHPRLAGRPLRQKSSRRRTGNRVITITHPDKILFPDNGITKGELAAYYEMIAPVMVPHMRGRPVTMERYHRGIGAPGFFQKDVSKGFPDWLKRVEVPEEGRHGSSSDRHRHAVARCGSPTRTASRRTCGPRARPSCITPTSACSISIHPRTIRRNSGRRPFSCATFSPSSAFRAG